MGIMSYEKVMSYILMVKEIEMNPNYKPTNEQTMVANRIHQQLENDQKFKQLIDILLTLTNPLEMNKIYSNYASGRSITGFENRKENNSIEFKKASNLESTDRTKASSIPNKPVLNSESTVISKPKVFIKTPKNKKAGYIDALVLALVTGFAGGIVTMLILMMCS